MKGKLMFAAGIAAGFVVGSRAGKQSYAAIKERAQTVAQSPKVQNAVHTAKDFAEAKAPKLTSVVAGAASTVGGVADVAKDVPEATDETPETDEAPVDPPAAADDSAESTAPQA